MYQGAQCIPPGNPQGNLGLSKEINGFLEEGIKEVSGFIKGVIGFLKETLKEISGLIKEINGFLKETLKDMSGFIKGVFMDFLWKPSRKSVGLARKSMESSREPNGTP